jgi:hypothetical protein
MISTYKNSVDLSFYYSPRPLPVRVLNGFMRGKPISYSQYQGSFTVLAFARSSSVTGIFLLKTWPKSNATSFVTPNGHLKNIRHKSSEKNRMGESILPKQDQT